MRRKLVLVALAVVVVLAGCSGGGSGGTPQPIEANASQATLSDAALSATGYAESTVEQVRVNRSGTLRIAGDVQMNLGYNVVATGWRAVYRPSGGEPGVFAVYTVPNAKPENVAARIDPLGAQSLAAVVDGAQDAYAPTDLDHVRNRTTTVLDEETTVRQYAGTATVDGSETDVVVHVATVEHETDVVRAVAVTPAGSDDWATARELLGGVRH